MKYKGTLTALALCLALALLSTGAEAAETAGQWGESVTWSYQESTKTLTISGAGQMPEGPPPCNEMYRMERLVIESGVTTVSARSFAGSSLTSLTLPDSVVSIEEGAFENCGNLTSFTLPDSVVSIGEGAFRNCGKLTGVTFAGAAVSVGNEAFSICGNLTSVTFSGSAASIGDRAFRSCEKLSEITIPGDDVTIGEESFSYCRGLTAVTVTGDNVSVGAQAFCYCEALTGVTFQKKAGPIGQSAFSYCKKLKNVTFSGGAASIGGWAFEWCEELAGVTIGGDVGAIGERAFSNCEALSTVEISGSAASIGEAVFYDLKNLTKFHVGGTLGEIGWEAFYGCTGLTEFPAVDGGMTGPIYGYAFWGCDGLRRILLPEGVTAIREDAFRGAENLTAIWIPSSVTRIDRFAFNSQILKDVYYGGTETQWKAVAGSSGVQENGLPVIHYGSPRQLPEIEAGDGETLRRLIQNGIGAGLTEIELTGDIDLGGDTLSIQDTCNVVLDLKGHRIISGARSAITVVGDLTVKDSTETAAPAVTADNRVSYGCGGSISRGGSATGEVIDVQFGGSFTLLGGTVRSGSGDIAVTVTGASSDSANPDRIETAVRIAGGYVEAGAPAVSASGVNASVEVSGGVVLSRSTAVILSPETAAENDVRIQLNGGILINKEHGQLACGIYLPQRGRVDFDSGRIIVENGIGVLLRGGATLDMWLLLSKQPEITAGGSGTGIIGSSNLELPAGKKIVLDHKSGYPGSDQMNFLLDGDVKEQFSPTALPADTYELKSEPFGGDDVRYTFGPISFYQITFDPNGGTPADQIVMQTDSSGRITGFPAEPTRTGYVFRGWSRIKDNFDSLVWVGRELNRDTTLYAMWTPNGACVIRFYYYDNPMEGPSHLTDKVTGPDGVLTDWPSRDTWHGSVLGWFSSTSGSVEYQEDHVFTADTAVYGISAPHAPPYDITFDPNGAGGGTVVKRTDGRGKLTDWPDDPTREGYVFMGWSRMSAGGSTVGKGDLFRSSETLYAKWMPEGGYIVRFSLNLDGSGTFAETRNTNLYGQLERWPDTPQHPGTDYIFSGWYTSAAGGARLDHDHYFPDNIDLYAHWIERSGAAAGSFVVTFDPNGGTGGAVLMTESTGRLAFLPYSDPVRTGYTFSGWYTETAGGSAVSTSTVFAANATVYAHWTQNGGTTDPDSFTVIFDPNGGSGGGTRTTGADGKLPSLPADPVRTGYAFGGWYTQPSGGAAVTADTVFTENATVYAHWAQNGGSTDPGGDPDNPNPDNPGIFTVTFDPNGGTGGGARTTGANGKLTFLPAVPVRGGYTFGGWFTQPSGGTAVTTDTVFTGNATVYAQWTAAAAVYYRIRTPGRTPGGYLYVSHSRATAGTQITIESDPRRGYELSWLSATDLVTGREVRLWEYGTGEYTFTMPAGDVEVEASFSLRSTGGSSGGSGGSTGGSSSTTAPAPAGKTPVRWYYSGGAIYHVTDGRVPDGTWLTRDMLISVLYNLDSTSSGEVELWAVSRGVIPDIYKSLLWGADKTISREQTAVILFSYTQYKNYDNFERADLTGYTDHELILPIAQPAMSWARATGLIAGTSAKTLSPKNRLTCRQGSVILSRFVGDSIA